MIEVFKTNIHCPAKAQQLLDTIHAAFNSYKANFDLEDCDKILRVECSNDSINENFIHWLKGCGCEAETLP